MSYVEKLVEELKSDLRDAKIYLGRLESSWNGEDRKGQFEDRIVEWETAIEEAEADVAQLEKEIGDLEGQTDAELKVDLECHD
jgi:hypothetical protein